MYAFVDLCACEAYNMMLIKLVPGKQQELHGVDNTVYIYIYIRVLRIIDVA